MHSETSPYSGQKYNDRMHMYTVPEIELHQSLNGHAWIQWLGIASMPYSHKLIALFEAVFS
jgi:hypothetical protein